MGGVQSIRAEAGYLIIDPGSGPEISLPIADILRAADIPALTSEQVDGIRLLANLNVFIIRTLIEREILDETFADQLGLDMDLDHIIYAIEQLGGSYAEPDFDDVEDA